MGFLVVKIAGVGPSTRRGIAFLVNSAEARINAHDVYAGMKSKDQRNVLSRFDHWLSGGILDKYFHGWPNTEDYKECFTFKWKQAGTQHRFYGFLDHPTPIGVPGFQVCVLVVHAQKTDETDFTELDYINRLRVRPDVVQAVKVAFPDKKR